MSVTFSRRAILAGLLSSAAGGALSEAPLVSLRPNQRTGFVDEARQTSLIPKIVPRVWTSIDETIAAADLNGTVGCVLADADTGEILEQIDAEVALPPASVTKVVTALYALDALGGAFRFVTRVYATGLIDSGVLHGDLILAGGGDPTLSTDHLVELADALKAFGVTEVKGRFLCWRGALPYAEEIEPSQLDHLGYNPAISGLNLNYNRVYFEWARFGNDWRIIMDARTENPGPAVSMARVRIVDRGAPVFTTDALDSWTVARSALGNGGSRRMPVRQPALYAGEVFQTLVRRAGVILPTPEVIDDLPEGPVELAQHTSAQLRVILQEMLKYSNNLTAEVCGLAATRAFFNTSLDIKASAAQMARWLRQKYSVKASFVDHSGLSDLNLVSASDMAKLLQAVGTNGPLRPIMRRIAITDRGNNLLEYNPIEVRDKTGILNFCKFISGLYQNV